MARQQGVYRVAKALRLDYAMLKERAGVKTGSLVKPGPMPFVELMMPGAAMASESVIELTNGQGVRMTIRSCCRQDMVELAQVLMRQPK